MKINELVKYLCKHEGLKSQVKIGDMREIVGLISDMIYASADTAYSFFENGRKRAKKKRKKK